MAATKLKSLSGLAVKGVKAHAGPGEIFVGATLSEDKLVVTYKRSLRVKVSPRRFRSEQKLRMVTCERSFHDGDYVWLPTKERVF